MKILRVFPRRTNQTLVAGVLRHDRAGKIFDGARKFCSKFCVDFAYEHGALSNHVRAASPTQAYELFKAELDIREVKR